MSPLCFHPYTIVRAAPPRPPPSAKSLAGPWSALRTLATDPPSGDSYNTQHDFVIPVVGTQSTTWLYVGDRYSQWTRKGTGRNIFLPLVWKDGQPTLKGCDRWKIDAAKGTWQQVPASTE